MPKIADTVATLYDHMTRYRKFSFGEPFPNTRHSITTYAASIAEGSVLQQINNDVCEPIYLSNHFASLSVRQTTII